MSPEAEAAKVMVTSILSIADGDARTFAAIRKDDESEDHGRQPVHGRVSENDVMTLVVVFHGKGCRVSE